MGMELAIVGSRTITHRPTVKQAMQQSPWWPRNTGRPREQWEFEIVTGGADGVDSCAENIARDMGLDVHVIEPNWDDWSKGHPAKTRNTKIVERADAVLAVWDGNSTGTRDSIDKALDRAVPLYVEIVE